MGFILDVETSNVEGFHTVESGEYNLRILKVTQKNSKQGDPMLEIQMDIPDDPKSKDIFHYIMLPTNSDDEKRKTQKLVNLKEFKEAFGLPPAGPIDTDSLEGMTAWAIIAETEDEQYGKSNRIKRFVVGR